MGASDWRDEYTLEQEVEELFAAAAVGGILKSGSPPPIFVGHSYGARAVIRASHLATYPLAGVILVDSAIKQVDFKKVDLVEAKARVYPDLASALSRFALLPVQECQNHYLLHDVALAGLVECEGWWRRRFDPNIVMKLGNTYAWDALVKPNAPLAMIYAGNMSHVSEETLAERMQALPSGTPFITIPDADHHIMLDQPIALPVANDALASSWH